MNLKLIGSISFSLLRARLKQTLVAAFGVTFSITMFIALLSFMDGLNTLLDGIMMNRTAHVRLYNEIQPSTVQPIDKSLNYKNYQNFVSSVKPKNQRLEIRNNGAILHSLKTDDRVLGIAPKITAQIFYNVGAIDLAGVINGIDVEAENKLFLFNDYIKAGDYMDLKNTPNSIILGKGIAQKMLADLGDVIQVTTTKGELMQLKVVGYYESGIRELDNVQSYASISTAQKLMNETDTYITDLQIKLKDVSTAPQLAREYAMLYEVDAIDVQSVNAQFQTGSSVRTLISYSVGIVLLIVAGFGIYNILNMMIYDKMDSIAILKATGFSGKDVNRIFITIALSIGIVGGLLGLIFGLGASVLIDHIPFHTASLPTVKTYPCYLPLIIITGSTLLAFLAGKYPAK